MRRVRLYADRYGASIGGGKTYSRQWTLQVSVLDVVYTRFLLDESNTFGGTHYNNPRQVSIALRYGSTIEEEYG